MTIRNALTLTAVVGSMVCLSAHAEARPPRGPAVMEMGRTGDAGEGPRHAKPHDGPRWHHKGWEGGEGRGFGEHRRGRGMPPHVRARMLERFDANGDGALDESERAAARAEGEARRAEFRARLDTNGDGALDESERQAARERFREHRRERREEHRARVRAHIDTDGDGIVSDEEREAARARFEQRRAEMIERFDSDGDGVLNDAERDAMRAEFRARFRSERAIRAADTDRDGIINDNELAAALERYHAGDRRADFNGDGALDAADVTAVTERAIKR